MVMKPQPIDNNFSIRSINLFEPVESIHNSGRYYTNLESSSDFLSRWDLKNAKVIALSCGVVKKSCLLKMKRYQPNTNSQ